MIYLKHKQSVMKNITLTIIAILFSAICLAQQDPAAKAILDQLAGKTKSYTTIKSDILYRLEDKKEGNEITKQGNITIKGNKYILNLTDAEIYFDGTTMWNYLPEPNEVNVTEPDVENATEESFLENPKLLFEIYNKNFKYRLIGEKNQNGKVFYEIDLYPMSLEKSYSRIKLLIDKNKMAISSAAVFGKDGTNHLFTFDNQLYNQPVDDSEFKFDPANYPGVEVIDLRM